MNPEQQKLLNIYFTPVQQKVILSNQIIKDNILSFIEPYAKFHTSHDINDYKIVYPIRRALDFLATAKVKAKDNFIEKVNQAFEKITVFDQNSSENLIFTNLLLSEGKLPEVLAKLEENLVLYPVEEIQVNQDIPLDFYESILTFSNSNLNILQNANIQGITQSNSPFRFRPKSAISNLASAGQDARKQPSPSTQGDNELGSSDSDTGISPQSTAGDQRPVESQESDGNRTQTGDSTQELSQSTEGTQGLFGDTGRLNPSDYPTIPIVVIQEANELFELLNEGRKGHEVFTEFTIQALPIIYDAAQKKIGEVYVLKVVGLEGSLSNILDSNGVAINSPNWKRHQDTINEFNEYKIEQIDAYKRTQIETVYIQNARIEEAKQSEVGAYSIPENSRVIHPNDYPDIPHIVIEKSNDLFDLLKKGQEVHSGFHIARVIPVDDTSIYPKIRYNPIYVLSARKEGDSSNIVNLLTDKAEQIGSLNWRSTSLMMEDIQAHKKEIKDFALKEANDKELEEKKNEARNIITEILNLAKSAVDTNSFLQTIRQQDSLNTEIGKITMQGLFQISETDSKEARLEKFNQWFSNYKAELQEAPKKIQTQEKDENAEPVLRDTPREILGGERDEVIQPIGVEQRTGELRGDTSEELYGASRTSDRAGAGREPSYRIKLESADTELERFYLERTENKFSVTKKYADNLEALKTLNDLLSSQRVPTQDDRVILARYVGFGGLKDIVLNPEIDGSWGETNNQHREPIRQIVAEIAQLETHGFSDLLASVKSTILDAFYTSDNIIKSVYSGLDSLGFTKGNILEPSAGTGNFVGLMPSTMRENSQITQVEIDSISALVNKFLYTDTKVINKPFQSAGIKNKAYDLVISNIPFGDSKVYDSAFKGTDLSKFQNRIHNYFVAKAMQSAKEGAIIALVASKRVLDSPSNRPIREYIEQNGNFLGAVRLPHKAFENANTQVNADVILIQKTAKKLDKDIVPIISESTRIETQTSDGLDAHYNINEYFVNNPQNVLGEIRLGGMYDQNDYKVLGELDEVTLTASIQETLQQAKQKGLLLPLSDGELTPIEEVNLNEVLAEVKQGSIGLHEDKLFKKNYYGHLEEIKSTEPLAKIKDYLALKESLMSLINAEYNGVNGHTLEELRTNTRELHQVFIATYGVYNTSLKKVAKIDEDHYNVMALLDSKGRDAGILHAPTITPEKKVTTATDINDAITLSLYERNKIDIPFMATILNKTSEEVITLSTGLVFFDPSVKDYVHRDEYLSGNVKAKLQTIQAEIEAGNTQYQTHLDELSKIIPKDIPANLIEVALGARWIPTHHYREFVNDLFQLKSYEEVNVRYNKNTDAFDIVGENKNTLTNALYSTKRVKDKAIVEYAFGMESPIIRDKISSDPDKYVVNKEETALAAEKVARVREKFSEWIWKSPQRREELGRLYNDKFNTSILRKYDGSNLNFEGLNGINLYDHQKGAVWRLLQNNGGIIDHIVGGGKTFVMVAGTMKMKQLGIAQKPMIIALKSTVPQIVDAYRKAYPLANILAPTENDFKKENRLNLFSKIALNDWDCVIMTHDNFNSIPQSKQFEEQLTRDELTEIENNIADIEGDTAISYQDRKKMIARMQGQKKKVEARLEKLLDRAKDNTLDFQQMGIDHIMVDESQQFKNLTYTSKIRNVAGMSQQEGSKRAFNLLVAIRSLQAKFGGDKGTTFLSGTPISNSLVEMYLLFKYLRPQKMEELGFNTFDQWATNFAVPKTDIEFSVTGEFKPKTRFSEFINVPELAMLYTEIADIRNDENLTLDKPKMLGNGYQVKTLSMNDVQKDFGQRIIEFAKTKNGHILGIGQLTEGQENAYMLLATNLANKMSIDMRLIDPSHEYDPNGKVGTLVKTVLEMYDKTSEHKGTQLIFSDTGTPKNKASFGTLMLDYLMDEVNVDAEVLKRIFGDFTADTYRFPTEENIRSKISDELLMDNSQITELYELAKQSEPFNLYQEIKMRLIESGIPENQVVFIHDYNTAQKKEKLFQQVNAGEIRVVLGSTQKLGTGVNVQERCVALHHLDAPWRPSDMEQRNGRALRQGNKIVKEFYDNELPIFTYCSELSLDTYKYQLLYTKDFLIKQIKNDSIDPSLRVIREVEGDSDGGQNFGEILANLSGNKDILEKIKLEGVINKLEKSKKSFEGEVYDAIEKAQKIEQSIPILEKAIADTRTEMESAKAIPTIPIEGEFGRIHQKIVFEGVMLNGKLQETRKDFADELQQLIINNTYQKQSGVKIPIAEVFGYKILAEKVNREFIGDEKKKGQTSIDSSFINLFVEGKTGKQHKFNDAQYAGVMLNNLEKALMSFDDKLHLQISQLELNKEKLVDYKELSNRTWSKDAELVEVKEKLKEVMARLNSLDTSIEENKALIAAAKEQKALEKNPTQTQSYKLEEPITHEKLRYLWAIDSPHYQDKFRELATMLEQNSGTARPLVLLSLSNYAENTKLSNLQINWHNLPYNELPLASKFIKITKENKAIAEMRMYPDFDKHGEFIAIQDDFVLVLPPTKSHDYRMVDILQTLTRQDCETINVKGKHEYYIYPREYAEKFVNKKIDDTLNLVSLLEEKAKIEETKLETKQEDVKLNHPFDVDLSFDSTERELVQSLIENESFSNVLASPDSQNRDIALNQLINDVLLELFSEGLNSNDLQIQMLYKQFHDTKVYQEYFINAVKSSVEQLITEEKPLLIEGVKADYSLETDDTIKVTHSILGVTLTEGEKMELMDGKTVLLKGLINPNESKIPFDALVSIDASKKEISFDKDINGLSQSELTNNIEAPAGLKDQLKMYMLQHKLIPNSDSDIPFSMNDLKQLMNGKLSPLFSHSAMSFNDRMGNMINGVENAPFDKSKIRITAMSKEGTFTFKHYPKHETVSIPESIKDYIKLYDLDNMNDSGHLNRVIHIVKNNVMIPHFISLDKEINRVFMLPTNSIKIPNQLLGVSISEKQQEELLKGKPILLLGLRKPESPDKPFDAIVNIDAVNREFSFDTGRNVWLLKTKSEEIFDFYLELKEKKKGSNELYICRAVLSDPKFESHVFTNKDKQNRELVLKDLVTDAMYNHRRAFTDVYKEWAGNRDNYRETFIKGLSNYIDNFNAKGKTVQVNDFSKEVQQGKSVENSVKSINK